MLCPILLSLNTLAQVEKVQVQKNDKGMTLMVDGKPFMINGMNWDYFPIGTNYGQQ